jgi:hypothetical protein
MPFVEPPIRFPQFQASQLRHHRWRLADSFLGKVSLVVPQPWQALHQLVARADDPNSHAGAPPEALRLVPTTGDGRCLFRAIAKCLAFYGKRPLPEHLERADADALREAAFQEICQLRRQEFQKKHVIEGDMRIYCAQLRSPEFYAGEPEMYALADVLERPIEVYLVHPQNRTLLKIVEYGTAYRKNKVANEPVRVAYNGTNHYSALLPRASR